MHQGSSGRVLASDFEELSGLAESAGAMVVGRIGATRRVPEAGTFVGRGKAQEIADKAAEKSGDLAKEVSKAFHY